MSLFVTCTLDGWHPMFENAIAAPLSKGMQPVPGSNKSAAVFFIAFIVFSVFVMLNLFVGASPSYSKLHSTSSGYRTVALLDRL
jgi:Ion transport protein